MAISAKSWNRPKLNPVLVESFTPTAAVADNGSDTFIFDIYASVNSTNKVLHRIKAAVQINGGQERLAITTLSFPGSAATYASGGSTPADSTAITGSETPAAYTYAIDLNTFYTQAGDAQADS